MRDIPGLSADVLARAGVLSTKARKAQDTAHEVGAAPPVASIAPAKVTGTKAVVRLYNYIDPDGGYWGVSADEFAGALDAIEGEVTEIELRVNSGGGSVWDGLAILNTLRSHDAKVTAVVDGIAASAASFIAVACDEVVMMPNSKMMIHDALGICLGQAADMREYADFLDDSSDGIAEIYASKAGGSVADWRETMTAKGLLGQWYTPQEAVDAGLVDSVGGQAAEPEDAAPAAPAAQADEQPQAAAPEPPAPTGPSALQQRRHRLNARKHAAASR